MGGCIPLRHVAACEEEVLLVLLKKVFEVDA